MPEEERRARDAKQLEKVGGDGIAIERSPPPATGTPAEGAPGTETPRGPRPRETQ